MTDNISSERLRIAKILLSELRDKPLSWTDLEKRLLRQCGTHNKFSNMMTWLKKNGYIVKTGRSGTRALYILNSKKVTVSIDGEISIRI